MTMLQSTLYFQYMHCEQWAVFELANVILLDIFLFVSSIEKITTEFITHTMFMLVCYFIIANILKWSRQSDFLLRNLFKILKTVEKQINIKMNTHLILYEWLNFIHLLLWFQLCKLDNILNCLCSWAHFFFSFKRITPMTHSLFRIKMDYFYWIAWSCLVLRLEILFMYVCIQMFLCERSVYDKRI